LLSYCIMSQQCIYGQILHNLPKHAEAGCSTAEICLVAVLNALRCLKWACQSLLLLGCCCNPVQCNDICFINPTCSQQHHCLNKPLKSRLPTSRNEQRPPSPGFPKPYVPYDKEAPQAVNTSWTSAVPHLHKEVSWKA
jgi:hypothetical protein